MAGASQFILDTVIARYRDLIVNTLSELTGEDINVEFVVVSRSEIEQISKPQEQEKQEAAKEKIVEAPPKQRISEEKNVEMKTDSKPQPIL